MDFEKQTQEDLHKYLVSVDRVDKILPQTPDIDELWPSILEAYLPDGVREFRDYPIASLGWIMFVGMAVAKYWDVDWEKYQKEGGKAIYENLREGKGFDNLDEHILESVLGVDKEEAEKLTEIVGECASRTLSALHRANFEPGTPQAAQAYVGALKALYIIGAAMELNALGYHMNPLGSN